MYIEDGALILGLHDVDHLIGGEGAGPAADNTPGSEWLLEAFERSGELFLSGLTSAHDTRPIREVLESLGVRRIVIELEKVGVLNPGGSEMSVHPL